MNQVGDLRPAACWSVVMVNLRGTSLGQGHRSRGELATFRTQNTDLELWGQFSAHPRGWNVDRTDVWQRWQLSVQGTCPCPPHPTAVFFVLQQIIEIKQNNKFWDLLSHIRPFSPFQTFVTFGGKCLYYFVRVYRIIGAINRTQQSLLGHNGCHH